MVVAGRVAPYARNSPKSNVQCPKSGVQSPEPELGELVGVSADGGDQASGPEDLGEGGDGESAHHRAAPALAAHQRPGGAGPGGRAAETAFVGRLQTGARQPRP